MRDRGVFSAWVARIDDGAAGEAHARGEADGDVGYDSFHHPGTLCYADDGVVEFSTTRGPTATSSVVSALLYSTYNTGEGVRGSDSNDTLKRESMEESGMVSTSVANLPQRTSRAPRIRPRPPGHGLNGMHTCCQSGRALAGPTPDDEPVGLRIFAPTARWNGRLVRVR